MKIVKYFDKDGGGGNGSRQDTSLETKLFDGFGTVTKTPEQIQAEKDVEAAKGGGAGDGQTDLVKDQATLETLLAKDEASLTVDEKKNLDALKLKFDLKPLKEDGTEYTKEELEAQDKLNKQLEEIKKKPEDKRTAEEVALLKANTEEVKSVYDQVDELYGQPIEVDYGQLDPKSPEGILKREDTIRDLAVSEYDNGLKENFPVAYELMLHLKAGGSVEEFLENGNEQDYSEITLTKADVKAQENVYRRALALKGNTQELIDAAVQFAKDKSKLFEYSQVELEQLQAKQEAEKEQRTKQTRAKEQNERALASSFYKAVDSSLISGIQGVKIPQTEHKAFSNYLQDNKFFIKDGKLLSVVEVTNDNLQQELAAQYFKFKKADLSSIAQRKAESIVAGNIKKQVTKYKITPRTSSESNKNYVPMNQI